MSYSLEHQCGPELERISGQLLESSMNTAEQRNHKSRMDALEQSMAEAILALRESVDQTVAEERKHHRVVANQNRTYIDEEVQNTQGTCQERWDETARTHKRIFDRIEPLSRPTLRGRLRWLLLGQ